MDDKEKFLRGEFDWEDIKALVYLYDQGFLNRAEFHSFMLDALYVPKEGAIVIGNYKGDPVQIRKNLVEEAYRRGLK